MKLNCFFDLEIKNLIQRDPDRPHLKYCSGWTDFQGMGISCIGMAFDCGEPIALEWPTLVFSGMDPQKYRFIGFNSNHFDDRLLMANGVEIESIDFLKLVRIAAFGSPHWQDQPQGYTYRLDALALANGLPPKTGRGEVAPARWQMGYRQEVLDYCAHDVSLLRELWRKFHTIGIMDPNEPRILHPN